MLSLGCIALILRLGCTGGWGREKRRKGLYQCLYVIGIGLVTAKGHVSILSVLLYS